MKLYATTTSERASKGQGGNKQLTVNLKIDPEKRMEIGNVVMKYDKDDGYEVYYYPINENCTDQELNGGRVLLYKTKGKRQKDEKCECGNYPMTDTMNCDECCDGYDCIFGCETCFCPCHD